MITQHGKKEQLESNTKGGTKSINFQNHLLELAWGMFNVPLVPLFSRVQTFFDQIILAEGDNCK